MRIPMLLLLALTAFGTECTMLAFQPRPQHTNRMTALRFTHDSDDMRVRLAVLETNMNSMGKTLERIELCEKTELKEVKNELKEVRVRVAAIEINMNSMGKTLQRIELSGKKELKEVKTEVEEVNGSLQTELKGVNGKADGVMFWLIVASMLLSYLVGLGH
jgi:hypothetical protein